MDRAVEAAALAGSQAAADLSVWSLFLNADLIVKLVILLLVLASVWSWAIIFEKFIRLRRLHRHADEFEDQFWSGGSLEDLYDRVGAQPVDPMAAMFSAAMREWRRSVSKGLAVAGQMRAGLQSRIERVMGVTLDREMGRLERYMTFLASVGSTAPFIGLFGTVWGIMHSFSAIAVEQEHQPRGRRPRHRRGAVRDGARPHRRDPGGHRLQQDLERPDALRQPARGVLQRVRRDPVAAARREGLRRWPAR